MKLAIEIKERIATELGLTASAGVSYNKFLAKVASDARKPNGLCTIHPTQALDFIANLPIGEFWGVGRVTKRKMQELGIHTGADLRARSLTELQRHFGRAGQMFYDFARGIDERPVEVERIRKSLGCEHTFLDNTSEPAVLEARLLLVAEDLAHRLERKGFLGRTLTLKVKYGDFSIASRSTSQLQEILTLEEIQRLGLKLLRGLDYTEHPVRLLGLTISNPSDELRPGMWVQQWIQFPD